jgi:hypothetical protein
MDRFRYTSYGLGHVESEDSPSPNHFKTAAVTPELQEKLESMGLVRVAGNAYRCKSTKDFWKVDGNKVIRVTADEVDNGESIQAAPSDSPGNFLASILSDLTF